MIGRITATKETPTPTEIHFLANKEDTDKNQYISYQSTQGKVIAMVKDLHKTNKYFDQPESMHQIERTGSKLDEKFPTEEWEYTVAEAKALGVKQQGLIKRPTQPPSPGTEIKEPEPQELKHFLGFKEKGLNIGKIQHHDIETKLSLTDLFQKHLAVLAQTGAGKTHTVSVLIEELLDREREEGRPASIVMDVHGEYKSFAESEKYRSKTNKIDGKNFKIPVSSLNVSDFAVFLPGMSRPQKRELHNAITTLRQREGPYGIEDIVEEILKDKEMNEKLQNALVAWLRNLESDLFAETGSSIDQLITPGELTILDLSRMVSQKERRMLTAYIAERLFQKRRKTDVPPFILFVEEAHNFVKEGAESEEAIAKDIIETISREGRKFGASLCLVSQRPMQLSTTALSQCNTQIIMRITNPHDLDHISKTSEGIDQDSLESLTTLRVGESLIVGEAVSNPVFAKIRERKSSEIGLGENLEEQARRFEENKEKQEKDAEAFM